MITDCYEKFTTRQLKPFRQYLKTRLLTRWEKVELQRQYRACLVANGADSGPAWVEARKRNDRALVLANIGAERQHKKWKISRERQAQQRNARTGSPS
jgi:hypothetical protein